MSDKTTPSGKALEYFIKMCDSMALDPNAACNPELKTIRTALLRSQAIEEYPVSSGSEWNDAVKHTIERLKGIGHDDR